MKETKKVKRRVLHPNGSISYVKVPWEKVKKEIKELLEEDKELLEILAKL